MVTTISEFALGIILDLVKGAIEKVVDTSVVEYFERRKINRRVEDAVADVVEPLIPFLAQEKITEEKQRRLLQTCVDELRPFSQSPDLLFQGSLNGNKIFEKLYANRPLPEVVIEDGVKDVYVLLFPRVAELLCKVPAAIKEWESLAWQENYRRLDDLVNELRTLFNKVDELQHRSENQADELLVRVRRSLIQKIGLDMDITGLRGDQPYSGKLNEFFVHPAIEEQGDTSERLSAVLETSSEALAQYVKPYENNIIIGVAGSGKSTWTKWLQREVLNSSTASLAIRVELRALIHNALPSVNKLVRETAGKHFEEELTFEVISKWLDNQTIVFIFDGFDEVRTNERDEIYAWIIELCQFVRGCPVILTSRPLTTYHLDKKDVFPNRWNILPFDSPRIIKYIQNWYEHAPLLADKDREVNAESLASQWQNDPTLRPLTEIPLLLSTLLMVHHLDGRLPNGRSRLYQRYIDGMLGVWDDRRNLITTNIELSQKQKKQIISGLALYMFLQDRDQLDETTVIEWLEKYLKEKGILLPANDVLCLLRERSGLIIGPGIYTFAHKNIAEYLVAEKVYDGDQKDFAGKRIDRMYLFEKRDNDRWNSVIFLWAGLAPAADLMTFVDLCLKVKNLSLAFGIFYDQYDRVSERETRRRLLKTSIKDITVKQYEKKHYSATFYGPYGSPSSEFFAYFINNVSIRGIGKQSWYHELLDYALSIGDLTFEDRFSAPFSELFDYIWLLSIKHIKNADDLREYLKSPHPTCKSNDTWCVYVLDHYLFYNGYSLEDLRFAINRCRSVLPEYSSILPLLLISLYVGLYMKYTEPPNEKGSIRMMNILNLLAESDKEKIDPSWLLATRNWHIISFSHPRLTIDENYDLLTLFGEHIKQIKNLLPKGTLLTEEKYNDVLEYLDSLIEQRSILAAQKNIDIIPFNPEETHLHSINEMLHRTLPKRISSYDIHRI